MQRSTSQRFRNSNTSSPKFSDSPSVKILSLISRTCFTKF